MSRHTGFAGIHEWDYQAKNESRQQFIDFYRHISSLESIPADKQYWTIGGRSVMPNGTIVENSEYQMVVRSKLVDPDQFHSVEIQEDIHIDNAKAFPLANWHKGDLFQQLRLADAEKRFNPAIINYDSFLMPLKGIPYYEDILRFVDRLDIHPIMVVGNFIWERPRVDSWQFDDINGFISWLEERMPIQRLLANGWKYRPFIGSYPMKKRGYMVNLIFHK